MKKDKLAIKKNLTPPLARSSKIREKNNFLVSQVVSWLDEILHTANESNIEMESIASVMTTLKGNSFEIFGKGTLSMGAALVGGGMKIISATSAAYVTAPTGQGLGTIQLPAGFLKALELSKVDKNKKEKIGRKL